MRSTWLRKRNCELFPWAQGFHASLARSHLTEVMAKPSPEKCGKISTIAEIALLELIKEGVPKVGLILSQLDPWIPVPFCSTHPLNRFETQLDWADIGLRVTQHALLTLPDGSDRTWICREKVFSQSDKAEWRPARERDPSSVRIWKLHGLSV